MFRECSPVNGIEIQKNRVRLARFKQGKPHARFDEGLRRNSVVKFTAFLCLLYNIAAFKKDNCILVPKIVHLPLQFLGTVTV